MFYLIFGSGVFGKIFIIDGIGHNMGQAIYFIFLFMSPFWFWIGFRRLKFSNFPFYFGILVTFVIESLQSLYKAT